MVKKQGWKQNHNTHPKNRDHLIIKTPIFCQEKNFQFTLNVIRILGAKKILSNINRLEKVKM